MARLVTKFKYLKANKRSGVGGYANYIATREGVEKIDETKKFSPATDEQKKLIRKLLKDFPDSKKMLEYEDYMTTPTIEKASEFISRAIDDNAESLVNAKTYADYIATRPRAERFGSHGLFTDDGVQVQLSKVSAELNAHPGNVWTVILSLRREDAERLGFNHGERWRDMLRAHRQELADQFHIPAESLKWYAAFHNESHHPHVHLIVYSDDPTEGYLSKKGVEKLRSSFAKAIFAQDRMAAYEKQTRIRNDLRQRSRELLDEIAKEINSGQYKNVELERKILLLAERLSKTRGKKQYGYLKKDVKDLVDSIVEEIASDEKIDELYDLWYKEREDIIRVYTDSLPKRVPLSQNKEFKPVRNAVVQAAMSIVSEEQKRRDQQKKEYCTLATLELVGQICNIIQNRIEEDWSSGHLIESKERQEINEKKQAHGLRQG